LRSRFEAQLQEREAFFANISAAAENASVAERVALQAQVNELANVQEELNLLQAAENVSIAEREALQAQVHELQDVASKCASDLATQLQELQANAALQQASLQQELQAQADASSQQAALHQELQANASLEQAALRQELQANASLEQAASESRFQLELQDAVRNESSKCAALRANLGTTGSDFHKICAVWAKAGKCESSPEIMHEVCKTSCKSDNFDKALGSGWKLDPSKSMMCCCDINEFCAEWAEQGMCESNAKFMLAKCQYSCGACGKKELTES